MATILLITVDTTHAAATNTKAALDAAGHTVTLSSSGGTDFSLSAAGTADFNAYDALVVVRTEVGQKAVALADKLKANPRPLFICAVETGVSTSSPQADGTAYAAGLTQALRFTSAGNEVVYNTTEHPVRGTLTGLNIYQAAAGLAGVVDVGNEAYQRGTVLATGEPDDTTQSGRMALIACEANAALIAGDPSPKSAVYPKRWVFFGGLYGGQADYTADGDRVIQQAVTWITEATHQTDFSEYATGAQPADWSEPWNTGCAFAVVEETGAIGGKFLRKTVGEWHDLLAWSDIALVPKATAIEILGRVRMPASAARDGCGVYVRTSGAGQNGATGMFFGVHPGGTQIGGLSAGNYTEFANVAATWPLDTWIWVRGRSDGDQAYVKAWSGEFADEPAAWTAQRTYTLHLDPEGRAGANSYNDYGGEWDYFSVGIGSTAAPGPTTTVTTPGTPTITAPAEGAAEVYAGDPVNWTPAATGGGLDRTATGLLFRDQFDRADGAPGSNYTNNNLTKLAIESGKLVLGGTGQEGRVVVTGIPARTEMLVQARLTNPTASTTVDAGLMALADNAGSSAGSGFLTQTVSGEAQLWLFNSSSYVKLDSDPFTVGSGARVYTIYARGGQQEAWIDETAWVGAAAVTSPALSGYPAIRSTGTVGTEIYADDLAVCTTRTITATSLPAGYQLRAGGRTATESGGTATLDIGGLTLPLAAAEVLDGSGAIAATFTGETWGGDAFAFTDGGGTPDSYDVDYQVDAATVSGPHVVAHPTTTHAIPALTAYRKTVTARVAATNAGGSSAPDTQAFTLRGRLDPGAIETPAQSSTITGLVTFTGTPATDPEAA